MAGLIDPSTLDPATLTALQNSGLLGTGNGTAGNGFLSGMLAGSNNAAGNVTSILQNLGADPNDPYAQLSAGLAGMAQGFAKSSAPSRLPVPFLNSVADGTAGFLDRASGSTQQRGETGAHRGAGGGAWGEHAGPADQKPAR